MTDLGADLRKHAANKVSRTLMDVYQMTDDPDELMSIALMAASLCIGQAAGFLSAKAEISGAGVSAKDAAIQIMELLKLNFTDGPDAVLAKLGALQ